MMTAKRRLLRRNRAINADPDAGGGWQSRLGATGQRIFGGRMEYSFDNTTQKTFQTTAELPVPSFKRVKLVFANPKTTSRNIGGASVAALANTADLNGAAAAHVKVTFGGSDTAVLAASPNTARRKFLISDWVDIASIPRTDGGSRPLLLARVYESSSAAITLLGNSAGTDSFTNWASRIDGNLWSIRYNDGNCCQGTGTPANFVSTTARSNTGLIGFIFETANGEKVCTIEGFGDSITEGRGTYLEEGWGLPMCAALAASYPGISFSWANLGWSGQLTASIATNLSDAFAAGLLPDLAVFPNRSPNDTGNAAIIDSQIDAATANRDLMLASCTAYQVRKFVWTSIPTNNTVYNFGSSDSKRVSYDAATIADGLAKGYVTADYNAALTGNPDGNGQIQILSGRTTDGIHPNDSGNALLSVVGEAAAPLALALSP